ncbi:MAG: hypothetical protein DRG24_07955, partial [Epsilonproteobacteria bacterium]
TNTEGKFIFEIDKGCTLALGNIHLRTLDANELSDGVTIFESDNKIAAFLQSLDADANPANGIEIRQEVITAIIQSGISKIPDNETELKMMVEALLKHTPSLGITTVSYARATGHLIESHAKYLQSSSNLQMTDTDAFMQIAVGPVLYNVPVMAKALTYDQYHLTSLSNEEFNALNEEERYKVAIKLFGTLFYGVAPVTLKEMIASGTFISDTQTLFDHENSDMEVASVENKLQYYRGGTNDNWLMSIMLARMYHLQPGQTYLNRWAAYILTQSILFSPAYELDTVYTVDAINVYASLARDFDAGFSMQWVTFKHMMTDENWRRFRSPEDNGREMLEIYLMDFNDSHVPSAGQALKNWKLNRESNTLVMTLDENFEPITNVFPGKMIKNGTDFYSTLVLQTDFIATASRRLVNIYFPSFNTDKKQNIIDKLIASKPVVWLDILKQIVYSKEYLLDSYKVKSFEESFFYIAKTLDWHPKERSFYYINKNLNSMHQSTMRYKLGRKEEVPLDSQSFAWFHKTIRENVMTNYENNSSLESRDDGWPRKELFETLPAELFSGNEIDSRGRKLHEWYTNERLRSEYIVNMLFISITGRYAKSDEMEFLLNLIDYEKYYSDTFSNFYWIDLYGAWDRDLNAIDVIADLKDRGEFSRLVLDYISRLSSIYEFETLK